MPGTQGLVSGVRLNSNPTHHLGQVQKLTRGKKTIQLTAMTQIFWAEKMPM